MSNDSGPGCTAGKHIAHLCFFVAEPLTELPICLSDSDSAKTEDDGEDKENVSTVSVSHYVRTQRVTKHGRRQRQSVTRREELVTKIRACYQLLTEMARDLGVELDVREVD